MTDREPGLGRPVAIVDDEKAIRDALKQTFELEGFTPVAYASAEVALNQFDPVWPGVYVADINMPGMSGIDFLQRARELDADSTVILLTGHGDVSTAVEAMRLGAYDFLEKPFSNEHLLDTLARAFERRELVLENRRLRNEVDAQSVPGPRLLGNDEKVRSLRQTLVRIKDTDASVLVTGETGTGKEMVARFLHGHSQRQAGQFVALNCGALTESMVESLFFTPATAEAAGSMVSLASADGGTLFLDEVESLSESLQVSLLRFLEDRTLGSPADGEAKPIDLRVIAATKVNLEDWCQQGRFRQDLYYRLNVIGIQLPPLRDRREDIGLLFENFLRLASARYGLQPPQLTPMQWNWLQSHDWPGNVRELRNVADRLVLMGDRSVFDSPTSEENALNPSLPEQVRRFEKTLLQDALRQCNGRLKAVQRQLGLPRKTLYEKMRKYGLDKGEFKD